MRLSVLLPVCSDRVKCSHSTVSGWNRAYAPHMKQWKRPSEKQRITLVDNPRCERHFRGRFSANFLEHIRRELHRSLKVGQSSHENFPPKKEKLSKSVGIQEKFEISRFFLPLAAKLRMNFPPGPRNFCRILYPIKITSIRADKSI